LQQPHFLTNPYFAWPHILLPQTSFLAVLNARPLQVNNSGFDLSPVDMALFDDLKQGKAQLKKVMKDFRKGGQDLVSYFSRISHL
jgi:hypothetical protein